MTIAATQNPDGSITFLDDNGGAKNPDGSPAIRQWTVAPWQLAAHLRNPALQAAPGLTPAQISTAEAAPAPAVLAPNS